MLQQYDAEMRHPSSNITHSAAKSTRHALVVRDVDGDELGTAGQKGRGRQGIVRHVHVPERAPSNQPVILARVCKQSLGTHALQAGQRRQVRQFQKGVVRHVDVVQGQGELRQRERRNFIKRN
jgi:hypothetical protein